MKTKRFLFSSELSDCCNHKALLVQSRHGGFVSRNCLKCGKPSYVSVQQLPELACEFCEAELRVEKVDGRNYYYVCDSCDRRWKLASVLPDWSDLFEPSGLAAHGDSMLSSPLIFK